MSEFPYMNFFVADYMADTWTLDTIEHGAYCLLIFSYWKNGGALLDDDKELAKMTRLGDKKWKKVSGKVKSFFSNENGFLLHNRIEEELEKARLRSENARLAGLASGNARSTSVQRASNGRATENELTKAKVKAKKPKTLKTIDFPDEIPEQLRQDFTALRKAKKAPITKTALSGIEREAKKAGITLAAALEMCCQQGWQGFKAEWVAKKANGKPETNYEKLRKQVMDDELESSQEAGDDERRSLPAPSRT